MKNLLLSLGLLFSSFAIAGVYADPLIICQPIDISDNDKLAVTILSGDSISKSKNLGAAVFGISDVGATEYRPMDLSVVTGKISFEGSDANFTAKNKLARISLTTGDDSKLKVEGFDEETKKWDIMYDGKASCLTIQY